MGKKWTQQEIEYLRDNYKKNSTKLLAQSLNKSEKNISSKLNHLKLRRMNDWRNTTKEDVLLKLKEFNNNGDNLLASHHWTLYRMSHKFYGGWDNAKIIAGIEPAQKHLIIPEHTKDTTEIWYIIGVLLGDGHISKNNNFIVLNVTDKDFAETFATNIYNWVGIKVNVRERIKEDITEYSSIFYKNKIGIGKSYKCKNQFKVQLSSVDVVSILKTKINQLFNNNINLNNEYKSSFLRGLYDSEGTVSNKYNNIRFFNKDLKIIELVCKFLKDLGVQPRLYQYIRYYGILYTIGITTKNNLIQFREIIGFSIQRKQERLDRIK